jgi:hypothetical protein
MKTVILFGGGDAGGLIITENGVRPIPPFDPAIRLNLKSASAMVIGVTAAHSVNTRHQMAKLATSICNLAVQQVEDVVGPLDADRSLIFLDEDGGFTCGSTGKPPIPIPWPPQMTPSIKELIAEGVVETDMLDLVKHAHSKGISLIDIFEKPLEVAKQLGLTLSEKSANDLRILAPSRLELIKDPLDREIVAFFHKVTEDGRYLETLYSRPYEVSQTLKFKISAQALERMVTRGGVSAERMVANPAMAIVVVILIVIVWDSVTPPIDRVNDRSGVEKI